MTEAATGEARILVTGASGFVGRHALRAIADAMPAATVIPVDSATHDGADKSGSVSLDITKRADVFATIADLRPTAVLHLAAVAAPAEAEADPIHAWEVNVFGTMHLADAVLKHAPEARFLFVSSSEVYGLSFNQVDGPLDETALLQPVTPYATTKAAADLLVGQMAERGLNAIRFRPFNHTGPGQSPAYVVPAFADQIVRAEKGIQPPVIKVGLIDTERDFLDVRDVVRAYVAAIAASNLPSGLVVDLASGRPQSIRTILECLLGQSRVRLEIQTDAARVRPTGVPRTWGDNSRARSALNWSPYLSFDQTLTDVLEDWRKRVTL